MVSSFWGSWVRQTIGMLVQQLDVTAWAAILR